MPTISFSNHVEVHDITQHSRSLWDDLFYEDKEIAEFRHAAFLIECGLLQEDDDDSHNGGKDYLDHHESTEDNLSSNNNNHDTKSEADTIKSLDDWNASGSVATCSPGTSQRSPVSPSTFLHNSLPVLQVEFTRAEQLTKAKKKQQQQQRQEENQQHQASTRTLGASHSSIGNGSKNESDSLNRREVRNALDSVAHDSARATSRSSTPPPKYLHNSLPILQVEFTPGEQLAIANKSKQNVQHQPTPQNGATSTLTSAPIPRMAAPTDIQACTRDAVATAHKVTTSDTTTTSTPSTSRRTIKSVTSRPIRSPSKKVKSTSSHKMMVPKIQARNGDASTDVGTATVVTATNSCSINNNSTSSHNSSIRSKSFQVLMQRSKNQKQQLQQRKLEEEPANEVPNNMPTSLSHKESNPKDDLNPKDNLNPKDDLKTHGRATAIESATSSQSLVPAPSATPSRGRGSVPSSPLCILNKKLEQSVNPPAATSSMNPANVSSPSIRDKINLWKKRDETSTQNMGRSCSPHATSPLRLMTGNRDFDSRRARSLTPVRSMAIRATAATAAPATPTTTTSRPTKKDIHPLQQTKIDLPFAAPLFCASTVASPLRSVAVEARQQERLRQAKTSTTTTTTVLSQRHSTGSILASPRTPLPNSPRSQLLRLSTVALSSKTSSDFGPNSTTVADTNKVNDTDANKINGVEPSQFSVDDEPPTSTTKRSTEEVPPQPRTPKASIFSPVRPPRTPRRFFDSPTAASSMNKPSNNDDRKATHAGDHRAESDDSDDEEALQRFLDRVRSGKPASTTTTGLGLSSTTPSSPYQKQRSFSPSALRAATGLLATTTPSRRHYKSASWAANTASSPSPTPTSSRVVKVIGSIDNKKATNSFGCSSSSDSSSDSSDEEGKGPISPAASFLLKRSGRRLSIASTAANDATSPIPSTFKSPHKRSPLKRSPVPPKSSPFPKPGIVPSSETNMSASPTNRNESNQKKKSSTKSTDGASSREGDGVNVADKEKTSSKSKQKSKSSPSLLTVDSTLLHSNNKTPRSRSSTKTRTKGHERRSSPVVVELVPPPPLY